MRFVIDVDVLDWNWRLVTGKMLVMALEPDHSRLESILASSDPVRYIRFEGKDTDQTSSMEILSSTS